MHQNIKVDVIYYLMPSDFEMEFNLCGCCQMRLLNEKTQDRKGLVNSLAKAVSRSKVIILCGPLFEDEGLIKTVGKAISRGTESIKAADYGISFEGDIEIINGSTPLVTADGFFGGCIIESGPQSIIVLSESKNIRKNIMGSLVHQYIYDLSNMPETAFAVTTDDTQPAEETAEEIPAEETQQEIAEQEANEEITAEVAEEEAAEETQEEAEEALQEEAETEETTEEIAKEEEAADEGEQIEAPIEETKQELKKEELSGGIDLFIEPERVSVKKMTDYAKNYVPSEKDSLFISDSDYDYDFDGDYETRGFSKTKFFIIIILVVLALVAAVLGYLLVYVPYSKGMDFTSYVNEIFGPKTGV